MRRVERILIALALLGLTAPGAAQLSVYEEGDPATGTGGRSGVRLSANSRRQLIPEVYTVRRGDTLWDVTGRFYGNPWEWPRVWSYNPEITNPHWIYPLDRLRLLWAAEASATAEVPIRAVRPGRDRVPEGTVFLRQEGYLDREALDQAGAIVGSPEDHMLLSQYDSVYLEFDDGLRTEPRGEYTIFREIPAGEREQNEAGTLVRIYGTVRIDSYDARRRSARAIIIEALDPIERGFRVAPMPRQFDLVPPLVADRDLETRVTATLRSRQLIGAQQIVFIPVGREEGVRLGNRFYVLRAGDVWREALPSGRSGAVGGLEDAPSPGELPDEIIAEARVVHVRPHSATLLITRTVREVQVGDRAGMRLGY